MLEEESFWICSQADLKLLLSIVFCFSFLWYLLHLLLYRITWVLPLRCINLAMVPFNWCSRKPNHLDFHLRFCFHYMLINFNISAKESLYNRSHIRITCILKIYWYYVSVGATISWTTSCTSGRLLLMSSAVLRLLFAK